MSWWRRLLNLPPKGERWADQRRTRDKRRARRAKSKPPEWEALDPEWVQPGVAAAPAPGPARRAAGQPPNGGVMAPPRRPKRTGPERPGPQLPSRRGPQQPDSEQPRPAPPERPSVPRPIQRDAPWETETESSFGTWSRRFLRGLVVAVLLLAAVSGVRSWIWPPTSEAPPPSTEAGYPRDEAKAVASRFATAYLSWDENNKDARSAAIGMDLAAGRDATTGWNGRGKQTAGTAYPGEVKVDPGGVAAAVDVRVLVTQWNQQGKQWQAGRALWQRLSVPVARTATRVVVVDAPTYVSDDPGALPELPKLGATDDELTGATRREAEAFFKAYASSDEAVGAVAAPGAPIRSLNGMVKLDALRSWQVYAGNDNERRATAAVTWTGAGETTLNQNYTLTLRRTVAADGAERWQVAAVG